MGLLRTGTFGGGKQYDILGAQRHDTLAPLRPASGSRHRMRRSRRACIIHQPSLLTLLLAHPVPSRPRPARRPSSTGGMQEPSDLQQATAVCPGSLRTALREFAEEVGGGAVLSPERLGVVRGVVATAGAPAVAVVWIAGGKYVAYLVDEAILAAVGCPLGDLPARYKALPAHKKRHTAEMDALAWVPAATVVVAAAVNGGKAGGGLFGVGASLRPHVALAFGHAAVQAWITKEETRGGRRGAIQ
jgi:hypothetical protein